MAEPPRLPLAAAIRWTLAALAVAAVVLTLTASRPTAQAAPDPSRARLVAACAAQAHPVPVLCAAMMQRGWAYQRAWTQR